MILWLSCAPPRLDADAVEDRAAAFFAMDLEEMRAQAPALLQRVEDEPDPVLRREILREIGVTGDAAVRASLLGRIDGPDRDVAIESLSYDRPEGCRILADRWRQERAKQASLFDFTHQGIGLLLATAFQDISPECRPALRAVAPGDAAWLVGEPGFDLPSWESPHGPPVSVRTRADFHDASGIWSAVDGVWTPGTPPFLLLGDGTPLLVEPAQTVDPGAAVTVVGILLPVAMEGDPERRGRLVDVHEVRPQ